MYFKHDTEYLTIWEKSQSIELLHKAQNVYKANIRVGTYILCKYSLIIYNTVYSLLIPANSTLNKCAQI